MTVCYGLSGCATPPGNSQGGGPAPLTGGQKGTPNSLATKDPFTGDSFLEKETEGMVAGYVVDKDNQRLPRVYIRCICLDEPEKSSGAPIEIESQPGGSFIIPGLKRGKHYKLIARAEKDGQFIAGNRYVTVPNPRVVIELREEFVTPQTPRLPLPPPTLPGELKLNPGYDKIEKPFEFPSPNQEESDTNPGAEYGFGLEGTFELPKVNPETGKSDPAPVRTNPSPTNNAGSEFNKPGSRNAPLPQRYPEGFAKDNRPDWPPTIRTNPFLERKVKPTPTPTPPISEPNGWPQNNPSQAPKKQTGIRPLGGAGSAPVRPKGGVQVPSCVRVGNKLVNMALYDIYGNPWEWKVHRRGKIVLLDFWKTDCPPCIAAMTHLRMLQKKYGPFGLEILAIAAPTSGTPTQQKDSIRRLCYLKQTNYRLLLANEPNNPVLEQFQIRSLPTMYLLGENNEILMFHEGGLNRNDWRYLEEEIRKRLDVPRSIGPSFSW